MAMADVADSSTRVVDGCQIEVLAKDTSLFTSRNRQRCGRVFDPKCCARAPLSKLPTDPTPADLARSRDRALVHALDPEPKAHALEQLHVGAKPRVHDVALDAADLGLVDAGGLGEPLLAHAQLLSLLGKLLAHAPVVAAERAQSPDVFGPAGLGPRLEPLHELVPRLGHVLIMGFMHGQVKPGYFWRWRCRACQSAKRFRAIWIWAVLE